jgi:hypothetical protein
MHPMRSVFAALLLAPTLLFVSCGADEEPLVDASPRVDVQEMNVSFAFREQLVLRASQDEAILSGPTTQMQVQTLPYAEKKPSPAVNQMAAWALPRSIADQVRDQRSCGPLKSAKAFLPVDTSAPLRCDLVMDASGRPVVWMVGLGRPFEDVPFMQSSFVVLEEEQYHVFSYVHPFPEADATAQWLRDTFKERNPGMGALIWPNKAFKLLIDETADALGKQINPSSEEVTDAMAALRDLAFSVGPSRAGAGL